MSTQQNKDKVKVRHDPAILIVITIAMLLSSLLLYSIFSLGGDALQVRLQHWHEFVLMIVGIPLVFLFVLIPVWMTYKYWKLYRIEFYDLDGIARYFCYNYFRWVIIDGEYIWYIKKQGETLEIVADTQNVNERGTKFQLKHNVAVKRQGNKIILESVKQEITLNRQLKEQIKLVERKNAQLETDIIKIMSRNEMKAVIQANNGGEQVETTAT